MEVMHDTTAVALARRNELDREIMFYIRETRRLDPEAIVTAESVLGFLTAQRRRDTRIGEVEDRLAYLVDAGFLRKGKHWDFGRWLHFYTVTADGMDVLDGARPPRSSGGGDA